MTELQARTAQIAARIARMHHYLDQHHPHRPTMTDTLERALIEQEAWRTFNDVEQSEVLEAAWREVQP